MLCNETAVDMGKLSILRAASEKNRLPKKKKISLITTTVDGRCPWSNIFTHLRERNMHSGIQYPTTLSCKRKRERQILADL